MPVFIDTEFTDFTQIDLISIALVSEDGREFYAERTDYRHEDCNGFVRVVVPVISKPRSKKFLNLCDIGEVPPIAAFTPARSIWPATIELSKSPLIEITA